MSRNLNRYLFSILTVLMLCTGAQAGDFTYNRELKGVTGTWHKLVLPDDLFEQMGEEISTVRILGIAANGDTIEAPYIGNLNIEAVTEQKADFKLLNQTKNVKGYYYTFEIYKNESINIIELDLKNQNFDWKVSLSGSNDQNEWFSILDDYRIVSIKNELADYSFTTLRFPESQYRYYRLFIPGSEKPNLETSSIIKKVIIPGTYRQYPVKHASQVDKEHKLTTIDIELPGAVPVSWLAIKATDKFDFYRPVRVLYLSDSTKTAKGWEYVYSSLTYGTLSSIEEPVFRFANTVTRNLRVIIENGDNRPLHIDSLIVKGNVYDLTIRFPETANYFLYYGDKNYPSPDYDMYKFKDKIPTELTELTLGSEQVIPKTPVPVVKPLFENKVWLWAIMGAIILLLGWFSVKMMATKK